MGLLSNPWNPNTDMPAISPRFKPFAEAWFTGVQALDDTLKATGTARADAALVGDQLSEARVRNYNLFCDEPASIGGTNKGPNPLEFFMASVCFCENVTFARYAALAGLEVDSLETTARGHWDRRGQGEFAGIDPAFKDFVVETRVASNAPLEKIAEVVRITHKRCPMHATITKVGRVEDRLFVNGN